MNWNYEKIFEAFDDSEGTIAIGRKAFAQHGFEESLQLKKPGREQKDAMDDEAEAHLIALGCSKPPTGRKHWSLRLLQNRFVKQSTKRGLLLPVHYF